MNKYVLGLLLLAIVAYFSALLFFFIKTLKKEQEKSNRYFGGKIKHTKEERRVLDYYASVYVPIPENNKIPGLDKDGFELEDILLTVTQGVYDNPIPSLQEKNGIQKGDFVKLLFVDGNGNVERMWVEFLRREEELCVGILSNDSYEHEKLQADRVIYFHSNHIYAIQ